MIKVRDLIRDNCIVWGAGKESKDTFNFLEEEGLKIPFVVDSDITKSGSCLFGNKIINAEEFYKRYKNEWILISTNKYFDEIKKQLHHENIYKMVKASDLSCFGGDNEIIRDIWVVNKLESLIEGTRLLDAGAGEQKYKKFCPHLKYVSQDFCQYNGRGESGLQMGKWNTEEIDIVCDITNIPEGDKSFDAILCTEVFEHLKNPILAIKEFARLLKPDGTLICTAPFCSLSHFTPYHYSTGFSQYWYHSVLDKFGFDIIEMESSGNYFSYIAQELRRTSSVSHRYSDYIVNDDDKGLISELINILKDMSSREKDIGSSELLCYGYHVVARRKVE